MKKLAQNLVIALLVALAFGSLRCSTNDSVNDLIISGGTIYTMDKERPTAEALLIRNGKLVFFGSEDGALNWSGKDTRRIDLRGGIALPGLVDAHGHVENLGRFLSQLVLVGTTSPEEIRQMVIASLPSTPENSWIQGRGWDQNDWQETQFPTFADLAGTDSHPVYLRRVDGHACWVNRRALEICGIDSQSKDPAGGQIIRDADGAPTGVFVDNAADLIAAYVDKPSSTQRRDWIRKGITECNRLGLVGVHDAGVDSLTLALYRELADENMLTLRINAMLSTEETDLLNSYFASGPRLEANGFLNIRSIKIYADGALGSRGAWLLEPYSDEPQRSGLTITSPDSIYQLTRRALSAGFQACTHAIGDRAVRETLDAYQRALEESGAHDARLRIEHSQVISAQDIPRYAKLGVIPSMQPTHATSDMYWAEKRLGAERVAGAYAWRTLLKSGARLPFGSDFPVESANPLWGIYAAVTRQDHKGWPKTGWRPEEVLTIEEAVRGFTIEAAYAAFAEKTRGSLRIGMLADITILDKDIFKISPTEILKTQTQYTIVGGKIVYSAE